MLIEFLDFIKGNSLFEKEDKILLAVSGGVDSIVMAHLFKQAGFNFAIAHCNFKLRDTEADEDEAFVRTLASGMNVDFYSKQFETKKYARNYSVSTQIAARELRYQWFEELLNRHNYQYLATAHHLNDSLETTLYNFTKGTGITGLTGIPMANERIVRPLLFAERSAIEAFATANNLTWREDKSNLSGDYSRNLIRNEVVPLLRKINPGLEKTFRNTELRMQSTAGVLYKALENLKTSYVTEKGLDCIVLKSGMEKAELALLDELLKPYGYNFSQVKDIKKALGATGKLFMSPTHQLNIDREYVIISPLPVGISDEGTIGEGQRIFENSLFLIEMDREEVKAPLNFNDDFVRMALECLRFPLKVRQWQEGDYFYPLGMGGKKKLSDFMIDNKIPLNLKARIYVLESAGEIAWVIGHRLDERFKVKADTKYTLNFRLTYHD